MKTFKARGNIVTLGDLKKTISKSDTVFAAHPNLACGACIQVLHDQVFVNAVVVDRVPKGVNFGKDGVNTLLQGSVADSFPVEVTEVDADSCGL